MTFLYDHIEQLDERRTDFSGAEQLEMMHLLEADLEGAKDCGTGAHALSLQRSLYHLYKLYWGGVPDLSEVLEQSPFLFQLKQSLETYLKDTADARLGEEVKGAAGLPPDALSQYINELIAAHPASNHDIYEGFIPQRCSREDLRQFFLQESTMDVNTDDFLASMQIGCDRDLKVEIAHNYWDEMGRGKRTALHSDLFEDILRALDVDPAIQIRNIQLEALFCGNLQTLVAQYRCYFGLGVGFFYTCEHMASHRFGRAAQAWSRLTLPESGTRYHKLHIPLDVVHASNWLNNVLKPYVAKNPHKNGEVVAGVMYRLNSSRDYLDMLSRKYRMAEFTAVPSLQQAHDVKAVPVPRDASLETA